MVNPFFIQQKGLKNIGNKRLTNICFSLFLTFQIKILITIVKKLFVLLLTTSSCQFINAQDSVKIFSAYKFTLPGSAVQSKMVPINAGTFLMGSNNTEKNRKTDEGPQRVGRSQMGRWWGCVFIDPFTQSLLYHLRHRDFVAPRRAEPFDPRLNVRR